MQMPLLSLKNDRQPLLFESEDPGEVWQLFCELQNKLPKALLFITKDLNSAIVHVINSNQGHALYSVTLVCIEGGILYTGTLTWEAINYV